MDKLTKYKINSPKVIYETIDGETVIVNLDTGNYYSLEKVGADIWALIGSGLPVPKIIEDIAIRHTGERKAIDQAIHEFFGDLQHEGLIMIDETQGSEVQPVIQHRTEETEVLPVFENPILQKYTDMQDLLLLDPIHDVDETGWPSQKNDLPVSNG